MGAVPSPGKRPPAPGSPPGLPSHSSLCCAPPPGYELGGLGGVLITLAVCPARIHPDMCGIGRPHCSALPELPRQPCLKQPVEMPALACPPGWKEGAWLMSGGRVGDVRGRESLPQPRTDPEAPQVQAVPEAGLAPEGEFGATSSGQCLPGTPLLCPAPQGSSPSTWWVGLSQG